MKHYFLLLFVLPILANSQECKLKNSTDPFTHESKISTGFLPFNNGKQKISLSIDATPLLVDFFIWVKGDAVCFDDKALAEIIYEGEKAKTKLKNTGSMNCDGAFHFSFRNSAITNSQLSKLSTKKIESIKLIGNNKTETLITFTEEQKNLFMLGAACISTEGKSLIK